MYYLHTTDLWPGQMQGWHGNQIYIAAEGLVLLMDGEFHDTTGHFKEKLQNGGLGPTMTHKVLINMPPRCQPCILQDQQNNHI